MSDATPDTRSTRFTPAPAEVLTSAEMAAADAHAIANGVPSLTLMENAGHAVAVEAADLVATAAAPRARIAVLCGPGNNGGDGFAAARHLKEMGADVALFALRPPAQLKGDAAAMAQRWDGPVQGFDAIDPAAPFDLLIDAAFGTGLRADTDPALERLLRRALSWPGGEGSRVLAVDIPSGCNATTGEAHDITRAADRTVTFFRLKTGHLLGPARAACGDIAVHDIGIPASALPDPVTVRKLTPPAFADLSPARPGDEAHKYSRGHTVVWSGPAHATGAARLSARSALRAGSGLVTVAAEDEAVPTLAAHLTAVMIAPCPTPQAFAGRVGDLRISAIVVGPGAGIGGATREIVAASLATRAAVVLDADALTSFEDQSEALFDLLAAHADPERPRAVLTPHEGEFRRLFPDLAGDKLMRARAAAERSSAVVLLKGPTTVIAAPDGNAILSTDGPPWLATAGSGDVLAGFIAGRAAAPGKDLFSAIAEAVWLHNAAAASFGPGLIAEDLPDQVPHVLHALQASDRTA